MKLTRNAKNPDLSEGECERCQTPLQRWRGENDIQCHTCGANYNCFGQRLRDDLHTRPNRSEYDEDMGDLEGYELAMIAADRDPEAG